MNAKYLLLAISFFISQTALRSQNPNWSVNPGSFQYNASMVAQLNVDGVLSTENNTVGIFSGSELRGVGEPVPNTDGLYFLTIFSNEASGEALTLKAYLLSQNTVKPIVESFTFLPYHVWGTIAAPEQLHVWSDADLPISIKVVPAQFAIRPGTFAALDLAPFLKQDDNDPVVWTVVSSADLSAAFTGSMLTVTPNSPTWTGTQSITVTATEQTTNHYSSSRNISFTRLPGYYQPEWDSIPGQAIDTMETFADFDLDDFVQDTYAGTCLAFSYRLDEGFAAGTDVLPAWSVNPADFLYSMTVTGKAVMTPTFSFGNPGDRLAAFIGNTLAGVASPVQVGGKNRYFLTVFANSADSVSFRFFSAEKQRLYSLPQKMMFRPNEVTGSILTPYLFDASPLAVDIGAGNVVSIVRRDLSWKGWLKFHFAAAECDYPLISNDTSAAIFSVGNEICNGIDDDGNGLVDSADPGFLDFTPPQAICKNIVLSLDAAGLASTTPAAINNGSFDACGIVSLALSQTVFSCADLGANTVTLTVHDQSGLASACTAIVTVQDVLPPTMVCQNISIQFNASAVASFIPAAIFNAAASSDNCGSINLLSALPNTFNCNQSGDFLVTLSATDQHGNLGTCTAIVTVQPFVTISSIQTTPASSCSANNGSINIVASVPVGQLGFSLNGGITWQLAGSFSNLFGGVHVVTLKVFGNASYCTAAPLLIPVSVVGAGSSWYKDLDGDGYSDGQFLQGCNQPVGWYAASSLTAIGGDCNDSNPAIHPGAAEVCNGLDDDCSGASEGPVNIWTGNGDGTNWSDAPNWSNDIVPLPCQDVVIPAGNVSVAAGFHAVGKTLDVVLGAVLSVQPTGTMDVQN